jgi:restriction endonuclease S subunit
LNTGNVRSDGFNFEVLEFITREKDQQLRKGKLLRNDLVLTTRGTVGNIALYDSTVPHENIRINSGMVLLRPDLKDFLPEFLFFLFQSDFIQDQFESISSGSAQPQLPIRSLVEIRIPILEIDIQRRIVAQIEEERMLIASNKQLINMFEQKVTDTLSRLWEQ